MQSRGRVGGRPRTGLGRIVTLDSVSGWRRTGERGAAATGGYIHSLYIYYRLQTGLSLVFTVCCAPSCQLYRRRESYKYLH